jgi:predicted nucleic acid-binding protein
VTDADLVLIDTSSWIEALRKNGREEIRERVKQHLLEGHAAWNDMITVELWNGARGEYEKAQLANLEKEISCLPTTKEVWTLARDLARQCRSAGHTIPSTDLLITACGLFHGTAIEHCDAHIDMIVSVYPTKTDM